MKVIIELDTKDEMGTMEYFYYKCLDLVLLGTIDKYKVSIDGTKLSMEKRKVK